MIYSMNALKDYFHDRMSGEISNEMELQMILHMCRAFDLAGYNDDRPFDEHLASSMEARCAKCSEKLIEADGKLVCFYHVDDWEDRFEAEQDRMRELYEDSCPVHGIDRPCCAVCGLVTSELIPSYDGLVCFNHLTQYNVLEDDNDCGPHGLRYADEVARDRDGNPAWTCDAM